MKKMDTFDDSRPRNQCVCPKCDVMHLNRINFRQLEVHLLKHLMCRTKSLS